MSDSDIALAAIDAQIQARDKKIARLRPALATLERLQRERDALIQSRAILAASTNGHLKIESPSALSGIPKPLISTEPSASPSVSPSPILAAVDEILGDKELHVDDITRALHARGIMTSKAVITTSIASRAAKKIRYRRVAGKPNTFALLKGGEQEAEA